MEATSLVIFALALGIAAGSPGPSIAALVARVLVRGWQDVAPFVLAMWVGEALWLVLAVLGLAALAETFHWAFVLGRAAAKSVPPNAGALKKRSLPRRLPRPL